jgi:hypothetical protein
LSVWHAERWVHSGDPHGWFQTTTRRSTVAVDMLERCIMRSWRRKPRMMCGFHHDSFAHFQPRRSAVMMV